MSGFDWSNLANPSECGFDVLALTAFYVWSLAGYAYASTYFLHQSRAQHRGEGLALLSPKGQHEAKRGVEVSVQ